jgi:hypothetical protein
VYYDFLSSIIIIIIIIIIISAEGEQHTVRNKLKEDLQVMWHKVRLLQICEREKLQKLKTNRKFIKLQEETIGRPSGNVA